MSFRSLAAAAALLAMSSTAALAGQAATNAWADVRAELYGERQIDAAQAGEVKLDLPYRAKDDRRVPVRARVALPGGETIRSLSLIIDENPMPVSAVFDLEAPRSEMTVEVTMRLNGPSDIRAVVETSDGRLVMSDAFVKTSGVGACAAPPVLGAEEAIATLGEMEFRAPGAAPRGDAVAALTATSETNDLAALDVLHPQHSGMQMDQISLLFIPARYIDMVEVWGDAEKQFSMTGSISLSENPRIAFDLPEALPGELRVRLTDTEEATFEKRFPLGGA